MTAAIPSESPAALALAADEALAARAYGRAESLARAALAGAVESGAWQVARQAMRPLQEAVRWRRQNAADECVRLGTGDLADPAALATRPGLVLLTAPHGPSTAAQLRRQAAAAGVDLVVLVADQPSSAPRWRLGPLELPAPPAALVGRDLHEPAERLPAMHWFIEASEKLGDALLRDLPADPAARVRRLLAALEQVDDHELLHQALAEALAAITHPGTASTIK